MLGSKILIFKSERSMRYFHVGCGLYKVSHYWTVNDTSIRFGHHVRYNEIDANRKRDETFLFE